MNQSSSYYFLAQQPQRPPGYVDPREAKYEKYGNREELEAEIERDAALLFRKKQLSKIEGFNDYFTFLRSDFLTPVYFEGEQYATAAHAYHAAKSSDPLIRKRVQKAPTLQEMYNVAKTIPEPEGWNQRKLKVMEIITRDKFRRNPGIREKLQLTEDRELINTLHEKNDENLFWGIVGKNGQNQLGRVLEKVRQSIQEGSEVEAWIQHSFNLVQERRTLPTVNLEVYKEGAHIQTITLENKPFYIFGKLKTKCDVELAHPSISRVHAAIIVDYNDGCCIVDLHSKGGVKVDSEKINQGIPFKLKDGKKLEFGESTRSYEIHIDYSRMVRHAEQMKKNLEREVNMLSKLDDPNLNSETLKSTLGYMRQDTIYVSNLPYSCTEKDLRELFNDCGKIVSVRVPEDRKTRQGKGFAFVEFENEKGFRKALNYSGHKFYGRKLGVTQAEKKIDPEQKKSIEQDREKKDKRDYEERKDSRDRHERHHRDLKRRSRSRSKERRGRDRREDERRRERHHKKRKRSESSSSSSSSSSGGSNASSKEKSKPKESIDK